MRGYRSTCWMLIALPLAALSACSGDSSGGGGQADGGLGGSNQGGSGLGGSNQGGSGLGGSNQGGSGLGGANQGGNGLGGANLGGAGGSAGGGFIVTCNSGKACTADTSQYEQCVIGKCDSDLSGCYGPAYKAGAFEGPCGPLINCVRACPCDAQYDSCSMGCLGVVTSACQNCAQKVSACVQGSGCVDPCAVDGGGAGGTGGGGGNGGDDGGSGMTCEQLKACCAKQTGEMKTNCETLANSGNDSYCSLAAATFCN